MPPEWLFLETKRVSVVSYGVTAQLLYDVLSIDEPHQAFTMRQSIDTSPNE
jgi:hypothetical protein